MRFLRADINPWAVQGMNVFGGILIPGDKDGRAGFFVSPITGPMERPEPAPPVQVVPSEASRPIIAPIAGTFLPVPPPPQPPPNLPQPLSMPGPEPLPDIQAPSTLAELINFAQGLTDVAPPGTLFNGEPVETSVPDIVEQTPEEPDSTLIDLINFAQGLTDVAPPGTLFNGEPIETSIPDIIEDPVPPPPTQVAILLLMVVIMLLALLCPTDRLLLFLKILLED
jgi:hypothetical protein